MRPIDYIFKCTGIWAIIYVPYSYESIRFNFIEYKFYINSWKINISMHTKISDVFFSHS